MSSISGIIFDHDGTIINSVPQVIQVTLEVLEQFNFKAISEEQIRHSMVLATKERLAHSAGCPEDLKLGAEMAEAWFKRADQLELDHTVAYDGIHEMVSDVSKDFKLSVLSNNRGSLVRKILRKQKLSQYFSIIFGEEDISAPKPDGRGVESILRTWELEAHQVLFVGDSASDIGAAKAVGCQTLGVCWGAHTREELEPMEWDTLVDTVPQAHLFLKSLV